MKKFVNDPRDVVEEMLDGFLATHAAIVRRVGESRVVARRDPAQGTVAVVAGGGSGHEPALLGYVGPGLLDAVVVGDLFASPPASAVVEAIRATDTGRGVLLLIGNYAGDVMNFEIAAGRAREAGHAVELQIVTDDVGLGRFGDARARRGMAGSFFAWKACGAAAAAGAPLDQVREVAARTNGRVRTVAVAHTAATLPGAGRPLFEVAEGEIHFGVGHGEPGARCQAMRPVDAIVDEMVAHLLHPDLPALDGSRLVTLVNGLGAVPLLELYVVQRRLTRALAERGLVVARSFVGEYYTAMDTGGFSISLLDADEELLGLVEAPALSAHFSQAG